MPDGPGAAPAPGGGDGGGAPAAAPVAAPAPAPANTPAPGQGTLAPAPNAQPKQPSAEEQAAKAEDDEWDAAAKEVFPGLTSTNKDKKDEQAKSKKGDEATPAPAGNPDGKEPNAEPGNGDDTPPEGGDNPAKPNEADKPDTTARDNRVAQREWQQRVDAIKTDVRDKMYADLPKTLVDADGDPIKSIEDVMKLINPRTGKLFTDTEAGTWFLAAQQQFNESMAKIDKQIDAISELNADIRDQVDVVNYKYGAWLKANPEERDALYQEWQDTLTFDEKSGIITAMPYSLEKFYDRALKNVDTTVTTDSTTVAAPAAPGVQTDDEKAADAKAAADAEAKAKADADNARKAKRADRSDVYSAPQPDNRDEEDKEWDQAAADYYGPQLKK